MRTTIDMPDALLRRTKAIAAARGTTLKQVIVSAVEREVNPAGALQAPRRRRALPVIHLESGRTLDLSKFNFDDLLA
jgi:hypothetical protein